MQRVIIQVPTSKKLRDAATKAAEEQGFSSLQEALRVFMAKLAKKELKVQIQKTEYIEYLTPRQEQVLKEMHEEFLEDEKEGNLKTYTSVDKMMKDLTS
jgi:hypothetical protein